MLAHKVNEDARLFFFDVTYPEGYNAWFASLEKDMDYLRSRILTYRSAHTTGMDMETSQYYEGAKTLVDILDGFFSAGVVNSLHNLTLMIQNIKEPEHFCHAEIGFKMNVKILIQGDGYYHGDFDVSLIYTRECANNPNGAFIIHGKNTDTMKEFTIGSTPVSEMKIIGDHLNWLPEDAKCFPAGPILKYSENFPTYGMLWYMINEAVRTCLEKTDYSK